MKVDGKATTEDTMEVLNQGLEDLSQSFICNKLRGVLVDLAAREQSL